MGKGGTRYVSDSVSSRTARGGAYTSKDLKKNMEKYLESGVHPDVARAQQEAAAGSNIPALPEHDPNRPFVMLELSLDAQLLGRLVVELFEDVTPIAAAHFRTRCLPGGTFGLRGSCAHRLVPHYALFGGKRPPGSEPLRFARSMALRHIQPGTVSMAADGSEFVIALARALTLDTTHQVVGRVHQGLELLERLNTVPTMPDDTPIQHITISRCGPTNARGDWEELGGGGARETAAQAAARLQQESADTRSSVLEALQAGMKRKAEDDAPLGGGGGAAAAGGARPATAAAGSSGAAATTAAAAAAVPGRGGVAAARRVRARVLDDLLDGLSGEESSESGG